MVADEDVMGLPSSRGVGESVGGGQHAAAAASLPTRPGFPPVEIGGRGRPGVRVAVYGRRAVAGERPDGRRRDVVAAAPLSDPLVLRPALLDAAAGGRTFGELAAASRCPPVARAQLLHLLWHRKLGIDMSRPLADSSAVRLAGPGAVR